MGGKRNIHIIGEALRHATQKHAGWGWKLELDGRIAGVIPYGSLFGELALAIPYTPSP
jgi:hypothetical protein